MFQTKLSKWDKSRSTSRVCGWTLSLPSWISFFMCYHCRNGPKLYRVEQFEFTLAYRTIRNTLPKWKRCCFRSIHLHQTEQTYTLSVQLGWWSCRGIHNWRKSNDLTQILHTHPSISSHQWQWRHWDRLEHDYTSSQGRRCYSNGKKEIKWIIMRHKNWLVVIQRHYLKGQKVIYC